MDGDPSPPEPVAGGGDSRGGGPGVGAVRWEVARIPGAFPSGGSVGHLLLCCLICQDSNEVSATQQDPQSQSVSEDSGPENYGGTRGQRGTGGIRGQRVTSETQGPRRIRRGTRGREPFLGLRPGGLHRWPVWSWGAPISLSGPLPACGRARWACGTMLTAAWQTLNGRRPPAEQAQAECGQQTAPGAAAASKSGSTQPPGAGEGEATLSQVPRGTHWSFALSGPPAQGGELERARPLGTGHSRGSRLEPGSQWPSCHAWPPGPGQASAPATRHQAVPLCLSVPGGTEGATKGGPFKMHRVTSSQQGLTRISVVEQDSRLSAGQARAPHHLPWPRAACLLPPAQAPSPPPPIPRPNPPACQPGPPTPNLGPIPSSPQSGPHPSIHHPSGPPAWAHPPPAWAQPPSLGPIPPAWGPSLHPPTPQPEPHTPLDWDYAVGAPSHCQTSPVCACCRGSWPACADGSCRDGDTAGLSGAGAAPSAPRLLVHGPCSTGNPEPADWL